MIRRHKPKHNDTRGSNTRNIHKCKANSVLQSDPEKMAVQNTTNAEHAHARTFPAVCEHTTNLTNGDLANKAAHTPTDFRDDDAQVAGLLEASEDACQSVDITRFTVLQCSCACGIGTFRDEHLDVASLIMLARARAHYYDNQASSYTVWLQLQ